MNVSAIAIGMPVIARVGRNVIHAHITEILNERAVCVRNARTGSTFTVSVNKVDPDPEGAQVRNTASATPKKKTLLAIAYEVLEELRRPMSTSEILDFAAERGTFKPEEWGHTPTLTLYGTFVREAKKEHPRIRKFVGRGKWELIEPAH